MAISDWMTDAYPPKYIPNGFRNKKNGKIYIVNKDNVLNATNVADGQVMVLYHLDGYPDQLFVREIEEFHQKFDKLDS